MSSSFITLIVERQRQLQLSDTDIAQAMGFAQANVYQQIRTGVMKLPVAKVPALAKVLAVPASELLTVALREMMPELYQVIIDVWGPAQLSANELKLIAAYRALVKGRDVEPIIMDGKDIVALVSV